MRNTNRKGDDYMIKTARKIVIGSIAVSMMLGVAALPVFAQETAPNLGQTVKVCNKTANGLLKPIWQDVKDGKIIKQEKRSQFKDIQKQRVACIKDVQAVAKADRKQALAQKLATFKANREAKIAAVKARKAALNTQSGEQTTQTQPAGQ